MVAVWSLARERAVAALFGNADRTTEADIVSGRVSEVGRSSGTVAAGAGGDSAMVKFYRRTLVLGYVGGRLPRKVANCLCNLSMLVSSTTEWPIKKIFRWLE